MLQTRPTAAAAAAALGGVVSKEAPWTQWRRASQNLGKRQKRGEGKRREDRQGEERIGTVPSFQRVRHAFNEGLD